MTIGLVCGGRSHEHAISLASAEAIEQWLMSRSHYSVERFFITQEGYWCCNGSEVPTNDQVLTATVLKMIERCDLFFPVLHGSYGEDGMIQGFFEMLGKPYVGASHRSAAVAMDKAMSKNLVAAAGVATLPALVMERSDWRDHSADVIAEAAELTWPLFVKAAHLGSSIGVCRVTTADALPTAIEEVLRVDDKLIIEEGVVGGRELEFAAYGNDRVVLFPPGEVLSGGRFYDYEAKYAGSGFEVAAIASLSEELVAEGRELALQCYRALEASGLMRLDFFLDQEKNWWFNEANPIPGFTSMSLYPRICEANALAPPDLMEQLVILALQRHRRISL